MVRMYCVRTPLSGTPSTSGSASSVREVKKLKWHFQSRINVCEINSQSVAAMTISGTTALSVPSPVTFTDVKAPFVPQSLMDPVKWWDKSAHLVSSVIEKD